MGLLEGILRSCSSVYLGSWNFRPIAILLSLPDGKASKNADVFLFEKSVCLILGLRLIKSISLDTVVPVSKTHTLSNGACVTEFNKYLMMLN